MEKVVTLFSSGMDSTTLLYKSIRDKGKENVFPLLFNYGSKHNKKENKTAYSLLEYLGFKKVPLVEIPILGSFGGSTLTDSNREIPSAKEGQQRTTVVPGRNTIMLAFGISYAESVGATVVEFGACADDYISYPDCREIFIEHMATVAQLGSDRKVLSVEAPFVNLSKIEIVKLGEELSVPWDRTWTCYKGEELACGQCDADVERLQAFEANGIKDPIEYVS
jgi:7-cyano-7-deazaguanine synthase